MTNPSTRLALALAALLASPIAWAGGSKSAPRTNGLAPISAPQVKVEGLSVRPIEGAFQGVRVPVVPGALQAARVPTTSIVEPGRYVAPVEPPSAERMVGAIVQAPAVVRAVGAQLGAPANLGALSALSRDVGRISAALERDLDGGQAGVHLDQIFFGKRKQPRAVHAYGGGSRDARKPDPSQSALFIVNDEGIEINGRAAEYYAEVRRLVDKYQGKIDMAESLDVMDDTYRAVQAKLNVIEAVAKARNIEDENTHLEKTLIWVDGTMTDRQGRRIAVNTHQVYFHKASGPNKAASEIAEGNRRTDAYIAEMEAYFAPSGKAEKALGRLDEVVLGFDTRGYEGIKSHLRKKEKELETRHGKKFRFVYLDEVVKSNGRAEERPGELTTEESRRELSRLIAKYKKHGLQKIVEGVIYSRYVGLLLELKTLEHYYERGYTILQAGHELFDSKTGHYITELDTVVRSPEGKTIVVEAKSARVSLDYDKALQDKVVRKLVTYTAHREDLEATLGAPMDEVVFSVDVGREKGFRRYLEGKQAELSERFGLPVSFLFLESGPETASR